MGRIIRRIDVQQSPSLTQPPVLAKTTIPVVLVELDNGLTVTAYQLENGQYVTEGHRVVTHFTSSIASEYTASATSIPSINAIDDTSSPTPTPSATDIGLDDNYYSNYYPSSPTQISGSIFPTEGYPSISGAEASATNFASNSYDLGASSSNFWTEFPTGAKAGIIIAVIIGFFSVIIASIWFCCGRPLHRREKERKRESLRLEVERETTLRQSVHRPPGASVEQLGVPLRAMSTRSRERANARSRNSAVGMVVRENTRNRNSAVGMVGRESTRNRQSAALDMVQRGDMHQSPAHRTHNSISRVASRLSRHVSLRGGGTDAPPRYEEVVPPAHQTLAGGLRSPNHPYIQNYSSNMRGTIEDDESMGVIADGKMPISEIPFEDVVLESSRSAASGSGSSQGASSRDFGERHAMSGGDTRGHTNS